MTQSLLKISNQLNLLGECMSTVGNERSSVMALIRKWEEKKPEVHPQSEFRYSKLESTQKLFQEEVRVESPKLSPKKVAQLSPVSELKELVQEVIEFEKRASAQPGPTQDKTSIEQTNKKSQVEDTIKDLDALMDRLTDRTQKLSFTRNEDGKIKSVNIKERGVLTTVFPSHSGQSPETVELMTQWFPKITQAVLKTNDPDIIFKFSDVLGKICQSPWGEAITKNNSTINASVDTMQSDLLRAFNKLTISAEKIEKDNEESKRIVESIVAKSNIIRMDIKKARLETKILPRLDSGQEEIIKQKFDSLNKATKELKATKSDTHKLLYKNDIFTLIERKKGHGRTGSSVDAQRTMDAAIRVLNDCYEYELIDNTIFENICNRMQNEIKQSASVLENFPAFKARLGEINKKFKLDNAQPLIDNAKIFIEILTLEILTRATDTLFRFLETDTFKTQDGTWSRGYLPTALNVFEDCVLNYEKYKSGKIGELPDLEQMGKSVGKVTGLLQELILQSVKKLDPESKGIPGNIAAEVKEAIKKSANPKEYTPINWKRMQDLIVTLGYFANDAIETKKFLEKK